MNLAMCERRRSLKLRGKNSEVRSMRAAEADFCWVLRGIKSCWMAYRSAHPLVKKASRNC